ncbi:hypothetical protein [Streptomyces cupreus]|uniref:Uncharacterized protein n=1 Tax=Streptomyces cupreus TaxID=2759956 RepID=A0A7X1J0S5_9ACTN|nr:hypothetical protein [Streptomyces cupreus]MBC2902103.1 hypothetical protein [Streptomyces cupreus]
MDGVALAEAQEQLARADLEAALLAGLPPYSIEAAADGEETGVALVPEGRHALRLAAGPGGRAPPARGAA